MDGRSQKELDRWADRMAERIERHMARPHPDGGLDLAMTAICMSWLNTARVELEQPRVRRRQVHLSTGSRWVAVYENLPRGAR